MTWEISTQLSLNIIANSSAEVVAVYNSNPKMLRHQKLNWFVMKLKFWEDLNLLESSHKDTTDLNYILSVLALECVARHLKENAWAGTCVLVKCPMELAQ